MYMIKLIGYPSCSKCAKSEQYLKKKNQKYIYQNIKENPPTIDELKMYINKSNKALNYFFNTSGILYREMNLKDKINNMSDDEKLYLLSNNGMLIKRPILVLDNKVLVGFKLNEWNEYFEK